MVLQEQILVVNFDTVNMSVLFVLFSFFLCGLRLSQQEKGENLISEGHRGDQFEMLKIKLLYRFSQG